MEILEAPMEMVCPFTFHKLSGRALPEILCMHPAAGSAVRVVRTVLNSHGLVTCRQWQWKHRERQWPRQRKRQRFASNHIPDAKEGMHLHHVKAYVLLFEMAPLAQHMREKGRSCSAVETAVYALPAVALCLRDGNRSD